MFRDGENVLSLGVLARTHQHGWQAFTNVDDLLARSSSTLLPAGTSYEDLADVVGPNRARRNVHVCARMCTDPHPSICVLARPYTMDTTSSGDHCCATCNKNKTRNFLLMLFMTHANTANLMWILVHVRTRLQRNKKGTGPPPAKNTKTAHGTSRPVRRQRPQYLAQKAALASGITTAFNIQIKAQEPRRRQTSPLPRQCSRREHTEGSLVVWRMHEVTSSTTCVGQET